MLCVDEMATKVDLGYDKRRDIVDEFEDDGEVRTGKLASKALVLWLNLVWFLSFYWISTPVLHSTLVLEYNTNNSCEVWSLSLSTYCDFWSELNYTSSSVYNQCI